MAAGPLLAWRKKRARQLSVWKQIQCPSFPSKVLTKDQKFLHPRSRRREERFPDCPSKEMMRRFHHGMAKSFKTRPSLSPVLKFSRSSSFNVRLPPNIGECTWRHGSRFALKLALKSKNQRKFECPREICGISHVYVRLKRDGQQRTTVRRRGTNDERCGKVNKITAPDILRPSLWSKVMTPGEIVKTNLRVRSTFNWSIFWRPCSQLRLLRSASRLGPLLGRLADKQAGFKWTPSLCMQTGMASNVWHSGLKCPSQTLGQVLFHGEHVDECPPVTKE